MTETQAFPFARGPRTQPLGLDEERVLTQAYKRTRDPRLEQRLVESNVRLVIKLARECGRPAGLSLADLVQEGCLGLLEAVRRFDPRRGARLGTYARFWIRAFIMRYVMDNVRLVRVVRTRAQRAAFHRGVLPGPDVSLDAMEDADDRSLHEHIADPGAPVDFRVEIAELARRALLEASELAREVGSRDAVILRRRLLADEPEPLAQVARSVSLSGERVRQIEGALRAALRERIDPTQSAAA